MIFLSESSFNSLYYKLLELGYKKKIDTCNSRVGDVKDLGKVVYQIENDPFRLCFLKERNINPFFAYSEFSWIIEGSNLLKPLQYYIKNYDKFSNDGETLDGAYGFRLINYFKINQVEKAIKELMENRTSRRVVLTMYSPEDLNKNSNDIPCNTTIYLKIKNNKLNITILNRSNDLFLGVPYNVFVFYMLQVYIADKLKCDLGTQTHFTDSLHIYTRDLDKIKQVLEKNSLEEVKYLEEKLTSFDNSLYIKEDHTKVINRKFNSLNIGVFKNLFSIMQKFKDKKNIDCNEIPKNILGYCIYNWLKRRKDITLNNIELFDNIDKGIKLTNTQQLESLKSRNKEDIIIEVSNMRNKLINKFDELGSLLSDKDGVISINLSDKEKILNIVLLMIVREGIAEYIYAREIRQPLMDKLKEVMNEFNISSEEINYFYKYDNEIRKFINS